jgi:hypothetical protein
VLAAVVGRVTPRGAFRIVAYTTGVQINMKEASDSFFNEALTLLFRDIGREPNIHIDPSMEGNFLYITVGDK